MSKSTRSASVVKVIKVVKRIPRHLVSSERAIRKKRMDKVDVYMCEDQPILNVNRLTGESVGYGMVL